MASRDYFDLLVRIVGMLLFHAGLYYAVFTLLMGIMYAQLLGFMIFPMFLPMFYGTLAMFFGLLLMRGASMLTRFCYPSPRSKA